jgi:hypothetical protein
VNKPNYFVKLQTFHVQWSHFSGLYSFKNAVTTSDHTVTKKYKLSSLIEKICASQNVPEMKFFTPNFLYLISQEVDCTSYTKDSGRTDRNIVPWAAKINFQCIMLYIVSSSINLDRDLHCINS